MVTFLKVTSSKYIGPNDYTLRKCRDGSFSIFKGSTLTQWGSNFVSVRSAEQFLNEHDYIHASIDKLPISKNDLEAIKEIYNLKESEPGVFSIGTIRLIVPDDFDTSHQVLLQSSSNVSKIVSSTNLLIDCLDRISDSGNILNIVYSSHQLNTSDLEYIFAKKSKRGAGGAASRLKRSSSNFEKRDKKRSAQEITKNLIRVKSSNVWAYGVEIPDANAKEGNVYVQFKGKNGGAGDTYVYYDVDLNTWRKVLSSPSKGHAVWALLRNNFYYSKLTGDKKGKLPNAINH